ncbi:hypothetical protein EB815_29960 [Mesorhizobium loti]|nr:hypothetical protein EB815_29960 [Mesorhizobium loti]QKC91775.1 hypothetical protein EB230_27785 [Mesorhizobium sp. NZP2234]
MPNIGWIGSAEKAFGGIVLTQFRTEDRFALFLQLLWQPATTLLIGNLIDLAMPGCCIDLV